MLGLFQQEWNMAHCLNSFKQLAKRVFAGRPLSIVYAFGHSHAFLFTDSVYSTEALTEALQKTFGDTSLMFGPAINRESRHKFAVTASTTDDQPSCLLLTNHDQSLEQHVYGKSKLITVFRILTTFG